MNAWVVLGMLLLATNARAGAVQKLFCETVYLGEFAEGKTVEAGRKTHPVEIDANKENRFDFSDDVSKIRAYYTPTSRRLELDYENKTTKENGSGIFALSNASKPDLRWSNNARLRVGIKERTLESKVVFQAQITCHLESK